MDKCSKTAIFSAKTVKCSKTATISTRTQSKAKLPILLPRRQSAAILLIRSVAAQTEKNFQPKNEVQQNFQLEQKV